MNGPAVLEVAVDDSRSMGFGQTLRDLAGDRDGLPRREPARLPDQALQVLPGDVLHRDVMGPHVLQKLVHPADVFVGNFPGQPELVPESLEGLRIGGHVGPDELEGDFFVERLVQGPVVLEKRGRPLGPCSDTRSLSDRQDSRALCEEILFPILDTHDRICYLPIIISHFPLWEVESKKLIDAYEGIANKK